MTLSSLHYFFASDWTLESVSPLSWVHEKLGLEKKSSHTANFTLFFYKNFKVLINDSDSEQDSSSRPNCPKEVCQHREGANTETTKCSSCRDVPVKQGGNRKGTLRVCSGYFTCNSFHILLILWEVSKSEASFSHKINNPTEK